MERIETNYRGGGGDYPHQSLRHKYTTHNYTIRNTGFIELSTRIHVYGLYF